MEFRRKNLTQSPLLVIPFALFSVAPLTPAGSTWALAGDDLARHSVDDADSGNPVNSSGDYPSGDLVRASTSERLPTRMGRVGLAFLCGLLLGLIRWRSGGLGPLIITHVFADMMIFAILALTIGG